MAIKKVFQRYSFSDPHLNTVLHDYKRGINNLVDYFLEVDLGNLRLYDTDQSDLLDIKWNENESNPYTLNLKVNSANRTVDLTGNLTVESASLLNQDYTTDASPSWSNVSLGTGELTTGSINRASGTLTLEVGGTALASIAAGSTIITGDVLASGSDTRRMVLRDGSNVERALFQLSATQLVIDSDSNILFQPNNSESFRLLSAGNYGFGVSAVGTSAVKVIGMGIGTAPATAPADMIQLWSADRSAGSANLYYRAEGGLARPLVREFDVSDYGLVPDNNAGAVQTANVNAFDTLIGKMAAGDIMYFPKGVWYINDDLDVTQAGIMIRGDGRGSEIQQEVTAKMGFDITVSNITIRDLKLYGEDASGAGVTHCNAIYAHGADSSNYISNIKVIDCFIENWEMYGIYSLFVEQFEYRDNNIKTITYAGIMGLSSQDGHIHHNYIDDIKCSTGHSNNGYGIALSRLGATTLATNPRPTRILVDHNIVKNVATWEGIDTHSGDSITFDSNEVYGCVWGIVGTSTTDDGANAVAGHNINITNNIIDSGVVDGSKGSGIEFGSASSEDYMTGIISGNTIIGHGDEDADITGNPPSGGISVWISKGLVVQGNHIYDSSPCGIAFYTHNKSFVCSGNTINDPWTDTVDTGNGDGHARGIYVGGTSNTGYVGENTIARDDISKTYVIDTAAADDGRGVEIVNGAGNVVILGANYSEATTYLTDAGSKASITFGSDVIGESNISALTNFVSTSARVILKSNTVSATGYLDFNGDSNDITIPENSGYFRVMEYNSVDELLRVTASGLVGVGCTPGAGVDISHALGIGLELGADVGANTRTDTTRKYGRYAGYHYTNAEEPVGLMVYDSDGTDNFIHIGGGSALVNAATQIKLYTAANNTTTSGTTRVTIGSDGGVHMSALKSGANQGAAGAAANELWVDTGDQTIKLGT